MFSNPDFTFSKKSLYLNYLLIHKFEYTIFHPCQTFARHWNIIVIWCFRVVSVKVKRIGFEMYLHSRISGIWWWLDCGRGFPAGSDGKESACNAGDAGLIPGLERPLKEGITTHSSILAWRIPWTKEPGGLQSQRVGHDWATKCSTDWGRFKRNDKGWF